MTAATHTSKDKNYFDPRNYVPFGKPFVLEIVADRACFTNPINPMEKVSYPYPTPGALSYAVGAVYWHEPIRWDIQKIEMLNPLQTRRDTVKSLGYPVQVSSTKNELRVFTRKGNDISQLVNITSIVRPRYRVTVQMLYWKDAYAAYGKPTKSDESPEKHWNIMHERLLKHRTAVSPYLGIRECACIIQLADERCLSETPVDENTSYLSIHHVRRDKYAGIVEPYYYRCDCRHGVIEPPSLKNTTDILKG